VAVLEVDRKQVLAYRIAAQGLHREATDPADLAVFDLGLQDISQRDTAAAALVARLTSARSLVDDPRFVLAWSHRGAPHFHRAADLAAVTAALIPRDEGDAAARMGWQRKQVEASGVSAVDALRITAQAIHDCVHGPMSKGAVSTAVTQAIPPGLCRWCRSCNATHVYEQLLRLASLPGGARLEKGVSPAALAPLEGWAEAAFDAVAASAVVENYLRMHGPAGPTEAAGFVGTNAATVKATWPADLVDVSVDGRKAYLPAADVPALENPPEPDLVRLLPPWDPFLQSRDRRLLVPDPLLHKEIWQVLGNPGALLADGEIAGTWRTRSAGRRLEFTMSPFWTPSGLVRQAAEEEAERVAAARGFRDFRVGW
jgi:hypothetical protein